VSPAKVLQKGPVTGNAAQSGLPGMQMSIDKPRHKDEPTPVDGDIPNGPSPSTNGLDPIPNDDNVPVSDNANRVIHRHDSDTGDDGTSNLSHTNQSARHAPCTTKTYE
jgi:hypothetical protein